MHAVRLVEEMLRRQVAPALRELGMRSSGQDFRLPNEHGDHALLNFQRSRGNSTTECRFTANVVFYRKQDWQQARAHRSWLPAAPTASRMFSAGLGWYERSGP